MSRSRIKTAPVCAWTTPQTDTRKVTSWTAIDSELLSHPAVVALDSVPFRVYIMLILEAHGRQEFNCPYTVAEKNGIHRSSYTGALKELQTAGFIKVSSGAATRQANIIEFRYDWKARNPPQKKRKRKQPEKKTVPNHWGSTTPTIEAVLPQPL